MWMSASKAESATRHSGKYGVRADAWAKLQSPYHHSTVDGSAVQVRLYIDEPGKFTKDAFVSAYVKGAKVEQVRGAFEKSFKNNLRVIHFDRQADWEQPVRVAALVDFEGMSTQSLSFYRYNSETGEYKRLETQYSIDAKGYLRFTTSAANDIIISEGSLEKR
jgi:hypothetical protein